MATTRNPRGTGTWCRARAVLRARRRLTSRQIAEVIDETPDAVGRVMRLMAKRGHIMPVVPPRGALQWRLVKRGERP